MDIEAVNLIQLTFYTNERVNEIADFGDIIKKCCIEANKPGLKNMFSKSERDLINEIMNIMNLKAEKESIIINAGDTHSPTI